MICNRVNEVEECFWIVLGITNSVYGKFLASGLKKRQIGRRRGAVGIPRCLGFRAYEFTFAGTASLLRNSKFGSIPIIVRSASDRACNERSMGVKN
jgi:hypothetical protein